MLNKNNSQSKCSSSNVIENTSTLENSLAIITKQEEYENDKYRIKNKFNFKHNPYTQSQPNMKINSSSIMKIATQHNAKSHVQSKLSLNSKIKKTLFNDNANIHTEEDFVCPFEDTMCEIPQSLRSESVYSSEIKTQKESRNIHNVATNPMMESQIFITKDESLKEPELDDVNVIDEVEEKNNISPYKEYEHTKNLSKSSLNDMLSGSNAEKNNLLFSKFNSELLGNKNSFGLNPLYRHSCSYNLSTRLLDDEYTHKCMKTLPNEENNYKFITAFTETNKEEGEKVEMNKEVYENLLKMNNNTLYYLLFFLYDDINSIQYINKQMHKKIKEVLRYKHRSMIEQFKEKYKDILELQSYSYQSKSCVHNNNNQLIPVYEMIIKAKIFSSKYKDYYISHTIGYNFRKNKRTYMNIFQFDIRPKNEQLIWFSSEIEEYYYTYQRFCYTQNISSFSYGDIVVLRVGLFSTAGMVDEISWKEPESVFNIERELYEKKMRKNEIEFNRYKHCEIENIVHFWMNGTKYITNTNNNDKHNSVFNKFMQIVKTNFEIEDVKYDSMKFFYFKITMKAVKQGRIKHNTFFNFEIDIKGKNEKLLNECPSLYILNNTPQMKYQIREGNSIVFYITDN